EEAPPDEGRHPQAAVGALVAEGRCSVVIIDELISGRERQLGCRAGEQKWRELGFQESADALHIARLVAKEPSLWSDDEPVDGKTDTTVDLIGVESRGIARGEVGVEWRVGRRELLDI